MIEIFDSLPVHHLPHCPVCPDSEGGVWEHSSIKGSLSRTWRTVRVSVNPYFISRSRVRPSPRPPVRERSWGADQTGLGPSTPKRTPPLPDGVKQVEGVGGWLNQICFRDPSLPSRRGTDLKRNSSVPRRGVTSGTISLVPSPIPDVPGVDRQGDGADLIRVKGLPESTPPDSLSTDRRVLLRRPRKSTSFTPVLPRPVRAGVRGCDCRVLEGT